VELFGVAQLLVKAKEVPLTLAADATLTQVWQKLAELYPVLLGRVIQPETYSLASGYACNRNGLEFVKDFSTKVQPGDKFFLLAADAGG
jgi:molybdopterin converting factor small subunit